MPKMVLFKSYSVHLFLHLVFTWLLFKVCV